MCDYEGVDLEQWQLLRVQRLPAGMGYLLLKKGEDEKSSALLLKTTKNVVYQQITRGRKRS